MILQYDKSRSSDIMSHRIVNILNEYGSVQGGCDLPPENLLIYLQLQTRPLKRRRPLLLGKVTFLIFCVPCGRV